MDDNSSNGMEERKHKYSTATDGKAIIDVVYLNPSSNDDSKSQSHGDDADAESRDHDSIQDEMNGASMEDFLMKLHNLLSCGDHSHAR